MTKDEYWHVVDRCKEYVIDMLPEYLADIYCLNADDVKQSIIDFYNED